ncbi:MAG TPA: hypothetical protein VKE98_05465, partial [Gemmataceae bacterium]|nr:hypothetical protein [Gemmataceae bacterium]
MKILSYKTAIALVVGTGIVFWAVDVSSAQLFRNPFPKAIGRPPINNVPSGGGNVGGSNSGNQGSNLGNNTGNQGGGNLGGNNLG